MSFRSYEQIKREFGISTDEPEDAKKELLKRLKEIHPDTSSATSLPPELHKEEVLRLTDALSFLGEARREKAVMPVEEVTSLVRAMQDLVPISREREAETRLAEQIETSIEEARAVGRMVKILLTAVTALLMLLWMFPAITQGHPVLSRYIDVKDPVFNMVWLAMLVYSAIVWLAFKLWTDREIRARRRLKLELTQNSLFEAFIISKTEYQDSSKQIGFYKDEFVSHIVGGSVRSSTAASFLLGRARPIESELAQNLADIILSKAERKGVIKRNGMQSLRDYYTLTAPLHTL